MSTILRSVSTYPFGVWVSDEIRFVTSVLDFLSSKNQKKKYSDSLYLLIFSHLEACSGELYIRPSTFKAKEE
jgi:hypothetical protein